MKNTVELSDIFSSIGAHGTGARYRMAFDALVKSVSRRARVSTRDARDAVNNAIRNGYLVQDDKDVSVGRELSGRHTNG